LRRAEDELPGFREAKAKKRFSVVDFDKSNVRGKRQAEDERFASLDAGMQENCKPAESSAKAKKRFSVVDFVKNNVRGKRQVEASSSETTARCTLCGDKPENKRTCVLCGDAPHHARGRKRSISLDGDAFTRGLESTPFPASSTQGKGSSQTILEDFEFDDKVPQTSSPIRNRAFHRRSISADGISLTASIGKLPDTSIHHGAFCMRT
jgi:hypothetical protein